MPFFVVCIICEVQGGVSVAPVIVLWVLWGRMVSLFASCLSVFYCGELDLSAVSLPLVIPIGSSMGR